MTELKKSLGLPMLVFYGVGMILGAGIYSIIGKAAGPAGDTLWISFVIAAMATLFTALSYAELAAMYPKAGAEYVFLSQAFNKHKWIASSVGVAVVFSGAATATTVAIAFAGYLEQFIHAPLFLVAVSVLVLFTGLAILGIRTSAWVNILFTLIEVAGLGLIIYLGFQSERFADSLSVTAHLGTLSGAALIVFSFFGFENIVNLAEEAKKPKKDIPRAIFISLTISSVLYVLVGLAALALVEPYQLATSDAPLMLAAQSVSKRFGVILGVVALFSTANTVLISMIGASRVLYGMAHKKALPLFFVSLLKFRKTPWVASLTVLVLALAFLPIGKIEIIASMSSMATMIAFVSVNVALIALRFLQPDIERPFRVPLALKKIPIFPLLGILCSLIFMTQFNLTVYMVVGTFLALSAFTFYWREKVK
jgi:amino acid transporter